MNQIILIVDDEPHIRMLLEESLSDVEDEGVTIITAANGREALDLIQRHRPGLVLLDVMMPELNGYDVCRLVRADPELSRTHIIMLTAKGQDADRLRGHEAGANDYLTKPFDPDEILERAITILRP